MSTNSSIIETVDAFTSLLKKQNVLADYINLYAEHYNLEHAPIPMLHWYAWATQTKPEAWILAAFLWAADEQDPDRWHKLNREWNVILENVK